MTTDPSAEPPTDAEVAGPRQCPECEAVIADDSFRFCTTCGAALDSPEGKELVPVGEKALVETDPLDDDKDADRWWRRHWRLLAAAAAVVLIVPVGLFFFRQWTGLQTATGPVQALFEALEDRDTAALLAVLPEDGISNGISYPSPLYGDSYEDPFASPIWAPGALERGYTPPSDVSYEVEFGVPQGLERRENRSYATVLVTYTVAGQEYEDEFLVDREDTGWEREWSLARMFLDEVQVTGSAIPARVAGTEPFTGPILLPPGEYEVVVEDNPLVVADPGRLVVAGAEVWNPNPDDGTQGWNPSTSNIYRADTRLELEFELREGVAEELEAQMRASVEECAKPYQLVWETCQWALDTDSTVAILIEQGLEQRSEWEVTVWPQIETYLGDGQVVCTRLLEPGRATGVELPPQDGSMVAALPGDEYVATISPIGLVAVDDAGAIEWIRGSGNASC